MSFNFYIILAIAAVVVIAGCVSQSSVPSYNKSSVPAYEPQSGSPAGSPPVQSAAKFDFNYCGCGLHQSGDPMAELSCRTFRLQCEESDRDPAADPCIFYKEITDMYRPNSCNPELSNERAKTYYCVSAMTNVPCTTQSFIAETCGAPLCTAEEKALLDQWGRLSLSEMSAICDLEYDTLRELCCAAFYACY